MRNLIRTMFVTLFLFAVWGCSPPPDSILLSQFAENQDVFEKLAGMIIEDHALERVHRTYILGTSPGDERIAEYRRLLAIVGCLSISRYEHQEQSQVQLIMFAGGALPDDGIYKGFVFFPRGLPEHFKDNLVSSLDDVPSEIETVSIFYREINENWYLYFLD